VGGLIFGILRVSAERVSLETLVSRVLMELAAGGQLTLEFQREIMYFAMLRAQKIRNIGVLATRIKHATRELPPENADAARRHLNRTLAGADNVNGILGAFRAVWPTKRRKDAVLCVEYAMSASAGWWEGASDAQKSDFVHKSIGWLESKYGAENIVSVTLHRDETTPHLSVFVVPLKDGKLNASHYIGNRSLMASDQTAYAQTLEHLGIVRGIEKSQATHVTPSEFYARLKHAEKSAKRSVEAYLEQVDVPEPKLRDLTNLASFVKKVAKAAADPLMKLLKAQQLKIELLEQKVADREATLDEHRRLYGAFFSAIDAIPSPTARKRILEALSEAVSKELDIEQQAFKREQEQELLREQSIEYVAARLEESGEASTFLRGKYLAENMLSSGDHETFMQWLKTPPKKDQDASPEAEYDSLQERNTDGEIDFSR